MNKRSISLISALLLAVMTVLCGCTNGASHKPELYSTLTPPEEITPQWTMGFADREIALPEESDQPLYIAGYKQGVEISRTILDLPRASAVWMDTGGEGVLLIGVDCVGLSNKIVNDIRTDLAAFCEQSGCASVNIYATHNHAGIDTLGLWGPVAQDGKNDDYMLALTEACNAAAMAAYENRQAGTLFYGFADTDILRDSREPIVYDSLLHQFRFVPDDGSAGIRLVSYSAHAESLRSENTMLSRDFPGMMSDLILEETGDAFLYMPSAVGGLIMTEELEGDCGFASMEDNMRRTGRYLTERLLSIEKEEVIEPTLALARTEITVPLDNTAFLYYRFLGILDTPAKRGNGAAGYEITSEMSVLRLGNCTFALIPGEIFPELVIGGCFPDDRAASPENENPIPLCTIAAEYGHDRLFVLGLANDELGYIVPPNDFLVHDTLPYFETTEDAYGENHYEETNSTGIRTAACIAEALRALLSAMAEE
ncbi:MAG: hypothetical protein IJC71_08340 [Clostridia bacterium]|nr:hypothetical protein [Clostridia bacterium]